MAENWKPVSGFEGLYEVSDTGSVKSLGRWRNTGNGGSFLSSAKIMTPVPDRNGYKTLVLTREDGSKKGVKIHRLVAEAFIGSPESSDTQVNHIDFDKGNNSLANLEWVSPLENVRHAVAGNHKPVNGRPLEAVDHQGSVAWFPSGVAAAALGFSRTCIGMCLSGKRNTHKGYVWRYA